MQGHVDANTFKPPARWYHCDSSGNLFTFQMGLISPIKLFFFWQIVNINGLFLLDRFNLSSLNCEKQHQYSWLTVINDQPAIRVIWQFFRQALHTNFLFAKLKPVVYYGWTNKWLHLVVQSKPIHIKARQFVSFLVVNLLLHLLLLIVALICSH